MSDTPLVEPKCETCPHREHSGSCSECLCTRYPELHRTINSDLPSAADLDAVADEQLIRESTAQLPALPEETGKVTHSKWPNAAEREAEVFDPEKVTTYAPECCGMDYEVDGNWVRREDFEKLREMYAALSRRAQPQDASEDSARLNWLQEHEAHLHTHRERLGDGHGIWWNVVKRQKSISGHPLGSPRAAIDAAIERTKKAVVAQRKAGA